MVNNHVTLLGMLIAYMLITGWCLSPLNKRKLELGERLHLLARLGEDWQNEKAEIEYFFLVLCSIRSTRIETAIEANSFHGIHASFL